MFNISSFYLFCNHFYLTVTSYTLIFIVILQPHFIIVLASPFTFLNYIKWLSPLQLLLLRRLGLSDQLGEFQERKPQVRSHLRPALQPVPPCQFVQCLLACFHHYILFHSFSPFSWLILSSIGYLLYGPGHTYLVIAFMTILTAGFIRTFFAATIIILSIIKSSISNIMLHVLLCVVLLYRLP